MTAIAQSAVLRSLRTPKGTLSGLWLAALLIMAVMLGTLMGDILQAAMDPRVRAALK